MYRDSHDRLMWMKVPWIVVINETSDNVFWLNFYEFSIKYHKMSKNASE